MDLKTGNKFVHNKIVHNKFVHKEMNKEKIFALFFVFIIIFGVAKIQIDNKKTVNTFSVPVNKKIVYIDAGHGGWDPGKVSKTGINEKDINLAITDKLTQYLELGGAYVVTSRSEDKALATKKNPDLMKRVITASELEADIFISIHQNSYHESSVKGPQIFYYKTSSQSEKLAQSIQTEMNTLLNNSKRPAKENGSYFMLKKASMPSVIVECGFLSNWNEAELLKTEEYQNKIAWSIYQGIVKYYNEKE